MNIVLQATAEVLDLTAHRSDEPTVYSVVVFSPTARSHCVHATGLGAHRTRSYIAVRYNSPCSSLIYFL